jgi:hypothetical protein
LSTKFRFSTCLSCFLFRCKSYWAQLFFIHTTGGERANQRTILQFLSLKHNKSLHKLTWDAASRCRFLFRLFHAQTNQPPGLKFCSPLQIAQSEIRTASNQRAPHTFSATECFVLELLSLFSKSMTHVRMNCYLII